MENFKGTKGRWKIHERSNLSVISENNRMVASTGVYQTNTDNGEHVIENEANALLISKAPEMLEMLESILDDDLFLNDGKHNRRTRDLKKLIQEATTI